MTKQEYAQWSRQESPRSNGPLNILKAFVSGGVVCLLGQLLIFFFQNRGAGGGLYGLLQGFGCAG